MQKAEPKLSYKQLENEPDKHYAVFSEYMNMGKNRRINKLSHHGYSSYHIYHISAKHNWRERLIAYENTIGRQLKQEKRRDFSCFLSEYEENALLTFGEMQGRYKDFIKNISNFWPNEIEDKQLKEYIQKMNKNKKSMGNFKDIMPLYNDPSSDKNNISKQLNHIEKVLNIIGKFQIISDKFILKLEKGEFQKQSDEGDKILEELDNLSDWILTANSEVDARIKRQIEIEFETGTKIINNKKTTNKMKKSLILEE